METRNKNINLWEIISKISIAFALLISVLLIVNYAQYKTMDPVESELILGLVQRLNENPDDAQLRDQIRALDLLSRKAYFTKQWQVRTGGYLLLMSIILLVIAKQMQLNAKGKEVDFTEREEGFANQKKTRLWVSIAGGAIVIIALGFAFFNHQDLGENLNQAIVQKMEVEPTPEAQNTPSPQETIIEAPSENIQTPPKEEIAIVEEVQEEAISKTSENNKGPEHVEGAVNTIENEELVKQEEQVKEKPAEKVAEVINEEPSNTQSFPTEAELKANYNAFRGFGSNGIDFHTGIPTTWDGNTGDNILWKIEIPIHGYNSPIIWGDKLFLSGANAQKREVYCIDRNSGQIIWTYDVSGVPGSPEKSPKVTDDTGLAAPSLTTNGSLVFALFGNGDLVALDLSGKKVWDKNLGATNNHYGHSSSLVVHEEVLIVQYDIKRNPKLLGLNILTGEEIYKTPRKVKISWASPVLINTGTQMEVILAADPIIASYNPKTGIENWQVDCIFGEVGPSIAYGDGIVFGVNEYAKLVAIKLGETAEILWEDDELLSDVPSPIVKDGLMYLATSYGVVACYDATRGEKYWENEFDNGFYGSPIYSDGNIYLMDMGGIVHVFKAGKEFVSIASNPLGEDGMTSPAFMDGRIYIRGNKHLVCIGKK